MKRTLVFLLLSSIALAAAQQRLVFKDSKKSPRIQIEGNEGFFLPGKSFELSGNVLVKQIEDKLTMTCGKATGDFVKINSKTEFDNVHLTGGIHAAQQGEKSSFTADSGTAEYSIKDSLRSLTLNGDVVLGFSGEAETKATKEKKAAAKSSNMVIHASQANVTFRKVDTAKQKSIDIQTALVEGPISFEGTETTKVDGKTTKQKITVKASRLAFNANSDTGKPEVRLTGDLEIHEEDDKGDGPEITGARSLVFELDKDFNIVKVKFSSEGIGQIRSVFDTKSGKGGQ